MPTICLNESAVSFQDDPKQQIAASRFLSLVLRHRPKLLGIVLQEGGWAPVSDVLAGMKDKGFEFDLPDLRHLVEHNDKARFAFDESGEKIRANQGHSVSVDLQLTPIPPPNVLYHGTHESAVASIMREGLRKMKRHHVHLSANIEAARKVGERRGLPVVLTVEAEAMAAAGIPFFRSENGVWLVDSVPPEFLKR